MVSTLVPGGVTGLTLKLTFVVGGVSDAVNVTASVKPGDLSYSDVINGISGRAGGLGRGRRAQGEIGELRTVVATRIKSWSVVSPVLGTPSSATLKAVTVIEMAPVVPVGRKMAS